VAFVAPHFIKENHLGFNVNNEFNAVIVEALFSDKQLFLGKGAGSHPTASAVISHISAIKFDYKYEYRKTKDSEELTFTNDFYLKVYLGSKYIKALNAVPFYRVDELFQSDDYSFQTGWVKFSDLKELNLNHRSDLSLVLLPEEFKIVEDSIEFNEGQRKNVLEPIEL